MTNGPERVFPKSGTIYTETVVHSPPEQYAADAPYQLAIIECEDRRRLTVRVLGKDARDRAQIGDQVLFVEERDGVGYYRKAGTQPDRQGTESIRPLV